MIDAMTQMKVWCIYTPEIDPGHVGLEMFLETDTDDEEETRICSFYPKENLLMTGSFECEGLPVEDPREHSAWRTMTIGLSALGTSPAKLNRLLEGSPDPSSDESRFPMYRPFARVYSLELPLSVQKQCAALWRQFSASHGNYHAWNWNCVHVACDILNRSAALNVSPVMGPLDFEVNELHSRLAGEGSKNEEEGEIVDGQVYMWNIARRRHQWVPVGTIDVDNTLSIKFPGLEEGEQ